MQNFRMDEFVSKTDSAFFWQKGFQDPATPIMEGLINLHHHIFFFLIIIATFTFWIIFRTLYFFFYKIYIVEKNLNDIFLNQNKKDFIAISDNNVNSSTTKLTEGEYSFIEYEKYDRNFIDAIEKKNDEKTKDTESVIYSNIELKKELTHFVSKISSFNRFTHDFNLEVIWTVIPTFVLVFIAIPSFVVLYCMDEVINAAVTLKIIGHQWYWSYEYSDYFLFFENYTVRSVLFDSYMIPEDELKKGQLRLLDVDNRVMLPVDVHIRLLITAADVLHSWAVPSLGVKVDAVPGRLNQASIFIKRIGVFYGQCSEICGVNHGFMPIVVQTVPLLDYISWIQNQIESANN